MEIFSKIGFIRSLIFLGVFLTLWVSVLSQFKFRNLGPLPAFRYPQRNRTYYRVKLDPKQVKPRQISPDNLFGWLNRKNGVHFYLWTRQNPELAHELRFNDRESIKSSKFDPRKLTKIIIHGWADGASEFQIGDWLVFMRKAYLKFADVNVIAVDYSVYASFYLYVTARPELVAERVAEMISFLENNGGLELDPLHLIGWSWGAHICGIAGQKLNGRIGRITGIDPAGPTFRFVTNEYRLDKSDALFVDLIHVNGGKLALWGYYGLPDPLGHVDFYPNGQSGKQIGCPIERIYVYETTWCSHGRGVQYFTESIWSPLGFPACRCETFDKYIKGECPCSIEDTGYMGEHLSHNTTPGIYQLVTRPKPLFGHGIPLNLRLSNYTNLNNSLGLPNTDSNITITIKYKETISSQEILNTYNSKNYPNDDILEISSEFAINTLNNTHTDVIDNTKSEGHEDNDVLERRTRESNSTQTV